MRSNIVVICQKKKLIFFLFFLFKRECKTNHFKTDFFGVMLVNFAWAQHI